MAKPVVFEATKWQAEDGTMFDSEAAAIRHDAKIAEQQRPISSIVDEYRAEGEAATKRVAKMVEKQKRPYYPRLYQIKTKYEDDFAFSKSANGDLEVFWYIFKGNYDMVYKYEEPRVREAAEMIMATEDKVAAMGLVMSRQDYEYEGYESFIVREFE